MWIIWEHFDIDRVGNSILILNILRRVGIFGPPSQLSIFLSIWHFQAEWQFFQDSEKKFKIECIFIYKKLLKHKSSTSFKIHPSFCWTFIIYFTFCTTTGEPSANTKWVDSMRTSSSSWIITILSLKDIQRQKGQSLSFYFLFTWYHLSIVLNEADI